MAQTPDNRQTTALGSLTIEQLKQIDEALDPEKRRGHKPIVKAATKLPVYFSVDSCA